jgi:hypothetical protein
VITLPGFLINAAKPRPRRDDKAGATAGSLVAFQRRIIAHGGAWPTPTPSAALTLVGLPGQFFLRAELSFSSGADAV